jgi:hypothetical protein
MTMESLEAKDDDWDIEQKILFALKGIRYGSVEIVIHDSRIVQIERKEKVRFEAPTNGKR